MRTIVFSRLLVGNVASRNFSLMLALLVLLVPLVLHYLPCRQEWRVDLSRKGGYHWDTTSGVLSPRVVSFRQLSVEALKHEAHVVASVRVDAASQVAWRFNPHVIETYGADTQTGIFVPCGFQSISVDVDVVSPSRTSVWAVVSVCAPRYTSEVVAWHYHLYAGPLCFVFLLLAFLSERRLRRANGRQGRGVLHKNAIGGRERTE